MTTKDSGPTENHFATQRLPWLIGAAGLVVYLVSLNHWISLDSLGMVARLSGWLWQPELGRPLSLVVFAPLKLLPAAWFPWLANLVTALCAALVLQQLARSVAILRQDVAYKDLLRKNKAGLAILTGPLAWLPPVFAAAACGLQLGFWEHATAASGEMLSLLCFAVAFRCVLEFRLKAQDRWLYRGALAFALGMTEHWLMVGYLPAFIAAVIWVKGYGACLNWRFFSRLSGAAALGLSLYLLVPTLRCATAPEPLNFWLAFKAELAAQKHALQMFRLSALRMLVLTAVLPFVLLAVKWRSHTVQLADDTHLGIFFSKASGHVIHALFFCVALWVTLKSSVVPRPIEVGSPLLLYHYTWALVAGHCAGYLILFSRTPAARRPVKWPAAMAVAVLVVLPVVLVWKNLGDLRLTNSGALRELTRQHCDDLPAGRVTILSDEPGTLLLVRAELAARGREQDGLLVDTRSLPWPQYQRYLRRAYGGRWPAGGGTNDAETVAPAKLQAAIQQVATNESVVYLHPSSGFFYESFAATPQGWIQSLTPRTPEGFPRLATTPQTIATNEQLWQTRWTNQLAARVAQIENHRLRAARWSQPPFKSFQLAGSPNEIAALLAGAYAKVLDYWGVQAQRAGLLVEAEIWFRRALNLDPGSLSARINLEFATRRARGDTNRLTLAWLRETYPQLLARYDRWADVIGRSGPVDEPTFLFHTGRMYLAASNPRQALEAFARSTELAGDWIAPRLAQAQCQNLLGHSAAALALTEASSVPVVQLKGPPCAQWLQVRATALWRTGRTNEAVALVAAVAAEHRGEPAVLLVAADFLAGAGKFSEELKWREVLWQRDPKRLDWVVKKGHAELRAGEFENALATLTQALALEPKSASARLFRAVAALRAGRLEEARRDYQELLKEPAHAPNALFGLGGIAWRERDTNAMILYYQAFLTNSAAPALQAGLANQRLKDWQDE